MLDMLDRAAHQVYRPRSYAEADFHRAYLIWKLGGVIAARIAFRSMGLPSIDATRRHVVTHPIWASAGPPTVEELRHNLLSAFYNIAVLTDGLVLGACMMIDEIKIQLRLR